MATAESVRRLPLPPWEPADLAAALGPGPVALLDGITWEGRRVALVAWAPEARARTVAEAAAAADRTPLPPQAPPLLAAAVGRLDWDGTGRFWVPGSAALFDREAGELWVRGRLPAVPGRGCPPVRSGACAGEGGADASESSTNAGESGGTAGKSGGNTGENGANVRKSGADARKSGADEGEVGLAAGQGGSGRPGERASAHAPPHRAVPLWPYPAYAAAVREALTAMAEGRLTKVILSVPFAAPCPLPPAAIYRRLTAGSPPGLGFLLRVGAGGETLVGISPEPLVFLEAGRAHMHLLAGTRPAERASELAASPKDREEHAVAVEQARRDLEAVCLPGSVAVEAFMELERHPGLVHLASRLSGTLRPDLGPGDLVAACFPAGTVGGIPREAARALIDRLEPVPRGWYAGAVGAVLPGGGLQLWLTIRSLALRDGTVLVRAGAGLVPGSDPAAEWRECMAKAERALAAAGAALPPAEELMRGEDAVRGGDPT